MITIANQKRIGYPDSMKYKFGKFTEIPQRQSKHIVFDAVFPEGPQMFLHGHYMTLPA
jgi:hypothetical protein